MNFFWLHYQDEVQFWSEDCGLDLETARGMALGDCLHYQEKWERRQAWIRDGWTSVGFQVERSMYQEWRAAAGERPFEAWLVEMVERGRSIERVFAL